MMRNRWRIYFILVLVRLLVASTCRSTIHPDEHFQNPEVGARLVFDYSQSGGHPRETWEWQGEEPCRSVAPLWISSAAAFSLVKAFGGNKTLFYAERAVMLLLSFAIDICVYSISRSPLALLLLASSPLTLTFLVRPFSSSLETVALALSLYFASRVISYSRSYLIPLGIVLAFGVWTRITFVAFAFPLVLAVIFHLFRESRTRSVSLSTLLQRGSPAVFSFSFTAYCLAILDTLHFRPSLDLSDIILHPSLLVLTPLNLLKYNLSSDNLAQHGIHPRYLHVLVNLPMLFGVGLALILGAVRREWNNLRNKREEREDKDRKEVFWDRALLASFVVPVALLSIQPHQEPRFLVPLIVPLVLLAPRSSFLNSPRPSRKKRVFWSLWILHSLLFTIFFGCLHQGGLVPTLLRLNRELRDIDSKVSTAKETKVELVFWKTFMPPRHFVLPLDSVGKEQDDLRRRTPRTISITDLGGASYAELHSSLVSTLTTTVPVVPSSSNSKTLLISPSYLFEPAILAVMDDSRLCFERLFDGETVGVVHLDMDRLGEMVGGFRRGGWNDLGIGVWEVAEC